MRGLITGVILILLLAATGCNRSADTQEIQYPQWVLELVVTDSATGAAVTGRPEATFTVEPGNSENIVRAHDGSNEVYSRGYLGTVTTVWYSVRCAGYRDSERVPATFDPALAYTHSGKDGPEQYQYLPVVLDKR